MAKLDRLGWAAGASGVSFGVRVGVRVSDPRALSEAVRRLPPGVVPSPESRVERLYSLVVGGPGARAGVRRMHLVYADARLVLRTADAEQAMAALESDVRLYVAERARRRIFVHAGVVGWKGRALLLPGRSHTGKSRLVQALVRAGATYYSDEYAVLDGRGRVHPFPAALSIREDGEEPAHRVAAAELGGHAGLPSLPVGLVVVSPYVRGARCRLRRASTGAGALALLAHCVPARRRPAEVMARLSKAVRAADVRIGVRGDADDAARRLLTREADWAEEPA
jgi:hypothetical protein